MIYGVRRNKIKGIGYIGDEHKPKVHTLYKPKHVVFSYYIKRGHEKRACSIKAFKLKTVKKDKS
jgi:hypothetical protein